MKLFPTLAASWVLAAVLATGAAGQPLSFTNDIAPIFVQKCLTCHGSEKSKGGYRLDTFESLLKSGASKDPSITPGKPNTSKLFQLVTSADDDDRMPQKNEPLAAADIARIQQWIAEGANFDGPDTKTALIAIIPPIRQPDPPAAYPLPCPITALAFSPDGSELAASGYHEITIWNSATGTLVRRIKNVAQRTLCLAYHPNGKLLAAASGTPGRIGEVKLFDAASGALVRSVATSPDSMLAVAFSPDGSKLAAGGSDNAIRIFDAATGKLERLIEQHADWVTALAFSHSGELLASASRDKSARIYDTESGEMEHSYLGHGDFVFGIAFAADDQRVFSCGRDKKVHVWTMDETSKGKGKGKNKDKDKAGEISGFDGEVLKLIVTSNAVFTCSMDQTAREHSLDKTPQLLRTFGGHGDVVYALAFDEKSQRLATGSFDGKVRVWKTDNGELILAFTAAPGLLTAGKPNR
jgi:WD40 repeat protein